MRDGYQLRQLIDLVNELNYHDAKQRHLFGQMYEEMLRIMQSSKETGEYYTPRAVTQFIVQQLDPQLGEKFGDFACGTGGFLTAAIDHLNKQGVETKKQVEQLQNAIVGCELKAIPYLLCATNMLVHGIDNPAITQGTAFSKNINDYDEKDKVNVVGMNPPYGGMTTSTELTNFPENVRTSETAVLFLAYICKRLKMNGRAGVIIPDGFLFGSDNASIEVKKILLKEMNLHTIIRLPSSVFAPYTSITTNVLFFDNKRAADAPDGFKTKDVWVYRMDMPEGYKHFSKTKPILPEHMQVVKDWWKNRVEIADPTDDPSKVNYKAKFFSAKEIADSGYNLDLCKYPKEEEVILSPKELIESFNSVFQTNYKNILKALSEVETILSGGLITSNSNPQKNICGDLQQIVSSFPDKLRKSVLQEAVKGNLVHNDIPEGEATALELLQQILKERQERENKEKGKKAKKLSLSTIEDEPWELPEGWCWVKIGDIFEHSAGKSLNSSKQSIGKVYPYLTTSNVYWDGINFDKVKEMAYTDEEYKKCSAIKNDILVCEGGDVGRSCIWTYDYTIGLQNHVHRLRAIKNTDVKFFYYVLRFYKAAGIITAKGIGIGGFSANALKELSVPLPPLSIQHRIVEKIEEVFSAINKL